MENQCKEDNSESVVTGVFELPGEPAVVINGVPPAVNNGENPTLCEIVNNIESHKETMFGEWLVGRKVQKLFEEKLYKGKVTKFEKESGWYRIRYDDGDFEDLEWHELKELLLPLDITVPLKTLASKVIKKSEKLAQKSVPRPRNHQPKEVPARKSSGFT